MHEDIGTRKAYQFDSHVNTIMLDNSFMYEKTII